MKSEQRLKLKALRASFKDGRSQAENAICRNFLKALGGYESYFVYNSIGSEAATGELISALVRAGKKVFLPRVEGGIIVAAPAGETRAGAFGICEPTAEAYGGRIDVTVTPLLGINARGYRIGYGGGYYDKFFKSHDVLRVGIGFDFQICEFCEDEWDEPLDMFVSESGIINFSGVKRQGNENNKR